MIPPRISFEFFPPQSLEASFRLWETVNVLSPLNPEFVSVTYGAGGTTRELTHEAVGTIGSHYGLNVAAHLTCVEATREETMEIADQYARAGVRDLVALRGDTPNQGGQFKAHPDGFADSCELIDALAQTGKFNIRVGAYPEPHPDAQSSQQNIDWLKRKIDAGASSAITQFFFKAETYFRFRDACEKAGINVPIIPGILPVQSWSGVQKFAERCGTSVPQDVARVFEKAIRDGHEDLLALAFCTELCTTLIEGGVEDLHFYTLNRPELTRNVCRALGVEPKAVLKKVA